MPESWRPHGLQHTNFPVLHYLREFAQTQAHLLQEGGPLPGPETGLLSNTRKWIVRGDTCWQSKRFYWERAPGWRAVGKGTQENCSAAWLAVLGFMVMGLVSGWSLANHSNSESFLVAHASLSQDGCWREEFWEVDGQAVSPLHLSWTLLAGGDLLVPMPYQDLLS